ncbi:GPW/gp25 family protein [Ruegeria sp. HKCCD8929]|uniref:GPW/gp25 family protein n=1 Tax=Ruegeria sp. HKCCD8929 TaxID=2683006 RepID=UPI0014899B81|nr:GPW/gp25 family protein [Ruegeria sp. HKCCD8929]
MQVDFPYHFDGRDRTAETTEADHIRDLIEQILFTNPGERVNRPEFGAGIYQLLFAPVSAEQVATTEFMIRGALQQHLGRRIEVQDISAQAHDATITITIAYRILTTGAEDTASFTMGDGA